MALSKSKLIVPRKHQTNERNKRPKKGRKPNMSYYQLLPVIVFAFNIAACSGYLNADTSYCRLNTSRLEGGIKNHVATNFDLPRDNVTHHMTEVLVALTDGAGNCFVGLTFEGGAEVEAWLQGANEDIMEEWYLEHYNKDLYFLKYLTTNGDEGIPLGRWDMKFANGVTVPFFSVHQGDDYQTEEDDDEISDVIDLGSDGFGSLNVSHSPHVRACLEYGEFKNASDPSAFLTCGGVEDLPTWKKDKYRVDQDACVIDGLDKDVINVTLVANGSRKDSFDGYALVCTVRGEHLNYRTRLRFSASGFDPHGDGGLGPLLSLAAVVLGLLLCLAALAAAYFVCPTRGVVCFHNSRYAFLSPATRRQLSSTSSVARCTRFPISEEATVISNLHNGNDSGIHWSELLNHDDDQERLMAEGNGFAPSLIWPRWILEAKLMRFPARDISFDASKPLGCGNYGYVYNGTVKYGTASFDVAIKQARSVDSDAQDELLMEAEKLSRLRDHPNVVNIKGITLETAEDGLCRKYSLVLTLYTSGNLESFLRKNRETMSLAADEERMKKWGFQIASAMEFISEKGILHLDLATRNVLLTHPSEVAKISDFGLSKFMDRIDPEERFGTRGLPLAWLPLEVWRTGTLGTHASPFVDVWSYGVLLWEIFTLGRVPYQREMRETQDSQYLKGATSKHERLALFLRTGHRLASPWSESNNNNSDGRHSSGNSNGGSLISSHSPSLIMRMESTVSTVSSVSSVRNKRSSHGPQLYKVMCRCWNLEPSKRPTFKQLVVELESMLHSDVYREQREEEDQEREKYIQLTFDNHEYLKLAEVEDAFGANSSCQNSTPTKDAGPAGPSDDGRRHSTNPSNHARSQSASPIRDGIQCQKLSDAETAQDAVLEMKETEIQATMLKTDETSPV